MSHSSPPSWTPYLAAGLGGSTAELLTIPFDTCKVRMQLQGSGQMSGTPYKGFTDVLMRVPREEGLSALWKGLTPGVHRQMVFASLRVGLYEPIRDLYTGGLPPTTLQRIAAGITTGAIGILVANPTDVVKIRLQAEGRLPAAERRYTGTMSAYKTIVRSEGAAGLYRGIVPNICRNSVINAAELVSYDIIKNDIILKNNLMGDHTATHFICALGAGFCATTVGSPFDVVKTRVMNAKMNADGTKQYTGMLDCFRQTLRNEGALAFWKGFPLNFARIGSWNCVFFVAFEQYKRLLATATAPHS